METKVVLAGACRTPIGSMGGSLSTVSAADLGGIVIKEAVKRAGINAADVDHVYMGNVIQGGQGQNVARQAAVKAGLPYEVPAETINAVCGSGLDCVNLATRMIQTGEADIVIAGGTENMSRAPYFLENARYGYRMGDGKLKDAMITDALWDVFNDYHMGITAENVAEQWGITREAQDAFSFESQKKAIKALENKVFDEEIVPVEVKSRKETRIFAKDEQPRQDASLEKMSKLRTAFKKDGTVTAANASTINDGAAAIVVMSEQKARELGTEIIGYYVGGALAGVNPEIMGIGPVASTKKTLARLNMSIADIDLFEANEAFAAQALAVRQELDIPVEKLNVNGGAIALGHPVGASGARILITLLYEMKRSGKKTGLATLCIGGGMGCTAVVKRV
ncbi:MAG: acetyl-CoA C-acetyltransferase [Lachnospiraceae bacterium]